MLLPKREAAPQQEGDQPGRSGGSRAVTVAALTLIAIQMIWMTALLTHAYFRQDDYRYLDRALNHGFTWSYLMLVDAGHLLPVGFGISWVMARVSLYNWPLTALSILVLLGASCLALLRMLRTLFGSRPAILIPLTVYVFSPLALAAVAWWSVALEVLPMELGLFMAVDAHVRYLRSGRFRSAVSAAGWLLLSMAAMDKGAVVPLLLFALTSAYFVDGRWAVAAVQAAKRYWRAWALYGGLLAAYGVIFLVQLRGSSSQPGSPGPLSHIATLTTTLVGTTLVPGALGGPWRWLGFGYTSANPPAALQQLSWAIAALVAVASCWSRARAWRAWAILFGWVVVADLVPVVLGRLGTQPADLLGLQTRYVTDATAVLALCLGLAFLPLAGDEGGYRFRLSAVGPPGSLATRAAGAARVATAVVVAAFLAGSFWSLQALESATQMQPARSYIETARVAVAGAPRGTVIVDGSTPAIIMDPQFFWKQGYTSQVIGPLARAHPSRRLSWTESPRGVIPSLMIFNKLGQLQPASVQGLVSLPPPRAKSCWSATSAVLRIPLSGSTFRWPWTAQVNYSGPSSVLSVSYGGSWSEVSVPAGAHAAFIPVLGQGDVFSVRLAQPGPALCITSVTVGAVQPAQSGRAIPATAVPG